LKEVQDRLNDHNISVELTDAARKWLAKEGYDPAFGARPLKRAIQKNVESPLSMELLGGKFKDGGSVQVDVDEKNNKIVFEISEAVKKKKKKEQSADV
jgi:ATP-dependent Clp protease ATP-binding subunit ClpA